MSIKGEPQNEEEKKLRDDVVESGGNKIELKRELGLFSAINLILGVMIGSGIFVSPASALEHSGSVALCLIIWAVSGVISLLGKTRSPYNIIFLNLYTLKNVDFL